MPREPSVAWSGPIFAADTGLSPAVLLLGTGSLPAVHTADYLQTTQVHCSVSSVLFKAPLTRFQAAESVVVMFQWPAFENQPQT